MNKEKPAKHNGVSYLRFILFMAVIIVFMFSTSCNRGGADGEDTLPARVYVTDYNNSFVVRVATTCVKLRLGSKSENLMHILELLDRTVAETNPHIVLLSESIFTRMNPYGTDNFGDYGRAEELGGLVFTAMQDAALRHGIYLIFNINAPQEGGNPAGIFNSSFLVNPRGEIIGRYDKNIIPGDERMDGIQSSEDRPVFTINVNGHDVVIGMVICYDVAYAGRIVHPMYPGHVRIIQSMVDQGAQIIFNSTIGDYVIESVLEAEIFNVWIVIAGQDEHVWDKPNWNIPLGVSGVIDPTGTPRLLFSDRTADTRLSFEEMQFRPGFDGSFGYYDIRLPIRD